MIWLGLISAFYLLLRFAIVLSNYIYRPVLKPVKVPVDGLVSVCIPVRNEEKNIKKIVSDLLSQDYNKIEIIIYDDQSDDTTWDIINAFQERYGSINAIKGTKLPKGWMGKNHACHQMSNVATGDYLLFLDADVRLHTNAISTVVYQIVSRNLDMLSVFPRQQMHSNGEKKVVSLMNYILLSLLFLALVPRRNFSSLSAANGQFMLFKSRPYFKNRFHKILANSAVEDIRIARMMKKMRYKIAVMLGNGVVSCRMYTSKKEAINGFSKNVLHFFGNSYLFLFFHTFFTTFGFFIVLSIYPIAGAVYLLLLFFMGMMISRLSGYHTLHYLKYSIHQQLSFFGVIMKALKNKIDGKVEWKDRIYIKNN